MSVVDRLEIRGIRSYNPNKPIQMHFPVPVTIIVGHNGSGKTTIIECLKFACTGETPSSNKGHFVHAPKLAEETEIRGQVRMEFRDILNKGVFISRTLHTIQKQVTLQTRTLDGTIKRMGKDGKAESISMKCGDLDKEMIRCLGVSRSVLNNVIFCHQEDSLWPLSEGSTVKKKFDEIFGQKRHVKCVEEMRKKFKELKQENSLNQVELSHLENNEGKAAELTEELDRIVYKLDMGKQEVDNINCQITELKEQLETSHQKVEEVRKLERKKNECVTRVESVKRTKCQLEDRLQTNYSHPTDKLLQMLSSFERDFQDKRKKEHEYTIQLSDVSDSHEQAATNLGRLKEDKGRLKEEQKAYKRLQQDNEAMLELLADNLQERAHTLLGHEVEIPDSSTIIHWAESHLEKGKSREEKREAESRVEQENARLKIDELKKTLNQAQGEIKIKRETRKKVKEEMDKLLIEIKEIKTSASTLSRIEQDKAAADEEYKRFLSDNRLEEITTKLEQKSKEMRTIAEKQNQLSSELEILNLEAESRQDRERAEQDLTTKETEIEKILCNHEKNIKSHLGSMPAPGGHSRALSKYLSAKKGQVKEQNDKLTRQQKSLIQKESEHKMAKKQLSECEAKAKIVRSKIVDVCSNPAIYESEVERAEQEYGELKKHVAAKDGLAVLYGSWVTKLGRTHKCPLCRTELDESRASAVVENMQQKIASAPQEHEERKKKEKAAEQRFFALKAAATLYTQLNELEKERIPELTERVRTLSSQIEEERDTIEDLNDAVETLVLNEYEARGMEKDLDYVDRLQKECGSLKDKISDLGSRLVSSYTKTLKEAIEEQSKYQEDYTSLQHDHSRLMESKTKAENKKHALQQKCTSLKEQYLDLNHKLQGLKGMEERRKERAEEIRELSGGERHVEETVKPLEEELEMLEERLTTLKEEDISNQRRVTQILNRLSNDVNNARAIEHQLATTRGSDGDDLSSLTERLLQCEAEYESLKTQKKKLEAKLQQLKRELDSSEVQKRDLEDCLQIRKFEQELGSIETEMKEHDKKLSAKELASARSITSKLQNDVEEKGQQKAGQEGRNRGFAEQVARLKRELSSDMFKDAAVTYHNQLIKCHVGTEVAKDLDIYIIAYERAIMRFHSDKMEEINKTLRDLWVTIYRGGDIDYIEIRTDDDDAESASRRKTCHYRVVMVKGGISIDMRQHSSAGQRVLAALLIRLALAETFCDNCGIIALDEPTTNLDRDNIESLAQALSNFIKQRHGNGNFQLIVITHDEDFVELLGRSEYIDHYYKVFKDPNQYSVIVKKSVAGLGDRV